MSDQVERIAEVIYGFLEYDGYFSGKPKWVPGGNSEKQDEARKITRAVLAVKDETALTINDIWKQARRNHETYSATGSVEQDIRFFALALAGEAGEVANFVKKRWRDGDEHLQELREECADVLAYTIMLADALGMTPEDLFLMVAFKQQVFIDKMKAKIAMRALPPSEANDE